jgi:hypothetical protein
MEPLKRPLPESIPRNDSDKKFLGKPRLAAKTSEMIYKRGAPLPTVIKEENQKREQDFATTLFLLFNGFHAPITQPKVALRVHVGVGNNSEKVLSRFKLRKAD